MIKDKDLLLLTRFSNDHRAQVVSTGLIVLAVSSVTQRELLGLPTPTEGGLVAQVLDGEGLRHLLALQLVGAVDPTCPRLTHLVQILSLLRAYLETSLTFSISNQQSPMGI